MKLPPGIKAVIATVGLVLASFGVTSAAASAASITLHKGVTSADVANLQVYLATSKRGDFYKADYDGAFGPITERALKHWQKATHHKVTGLLNVGGSEWKQLVTGSRLPKPPAGVSLIAVAGAAQTGWAVDANKLTFDSGTVRVIHYDAASKKLSATLTTPAAFGGWALNQEGEPQLYDTTNGVFHIYDENANAYSYEYHAAMLDSAFFNGGDALHFDGLYASHGCIHIPKLAYAHYIYSLPIGTTVVVHGHM